MSLIPSKKQTLTTKAVSNLASLIQHAFTSQHLFHFMNCDMKKIAPCCFPMCFDLTNVKPAATQTHKSIRANQKIFYLLQICLPLFALGSYFLAEMATKKKMPSLLQLRCSHASFLAVTPGRLISGEHSCCSIKPASCVSRRHLEGLSLAFFQLAHANVASATPAIEFVLTKTVLLCCLHLKGQ